MMWWYGADGWNWFWMGLVMVLVWGGVISLVVWAVRALASPQHAGDGALDVLRRRLASGEITVEEYEKTRKVLGD